MTAREHIIPVFVPHLGCPNNCVFCNQNRISGSDTPATAETVIKAINEAAALTPKGTKRQLAFYGGSFTAIPVSMQTELLEAARPFVEDGTVSSIRFSTRPDAIDDEVLERLKSYKVETIELGAQSMDDKVLYLSGRGHTSEDVEIASEKIKAAGYRLILQMMTGLPGDSFESAVLTAKRIADLHPDGVRVYPTVIVKDTELYDMWKSGSYKEHTVEDAVNVCAEITKIFHSCNIPIIRMGLNPTEELSGGAAVAGAYHPALGEMVHSKIMLDKAKLLFNESMRGSSVILGVNKSDISKMAGQHRCNIKYLVEEFGIKSLKIRPADIKNGEITVLSLE